MRILALLSFMVFVGLAESISAQGIPPAFEFIRGDCNGDGNIDLADAVFTLDFLFAGTSAVCLEAQDANDDGQIGLSDVVYTLSYLTNGGPSPAAPFPDCGADPEPATSLGCAPSTACPDVPAVSTLEFGDSVSSSINPADEVEFFLFWAVEGDHLFIPFTRTSGYGFSLKVELLSGGGGSLVSLSGTAGVLQADIPHDGPYFLAVSNPAANVTGTYQLTLQRTVDPGHLAPIAFGQSVTNSINPNTEIHVFGFSSLAGDQLFIPYTRTSGYGFTLQLRLYDSAGSLIENSGSSGAGVFTPVIPADGQYFLWVRNPSLNVTGNYDLTLERTVDPGDPLPVAFGASVSSSINPRSEVEIFEFPGLAGDQLFIPYTRTSGYGFTLQLRLYDSAGNLIETGSSGAGVFTPVIPADGHYFLWVRNPSLNVTGNYEFTLERTVNPADPSPIAPGQTKSGAINPRSEVDVHEFTGSAGQEATIPFARTSGYGFGLEARLYDALGGLVGVQSGTSGTLVATLTSDGPYFIWMRNPSMNVTGTYNVSLYLSP